MVDIVDGAHRWPFVVVSRGRAPYPNEVDSLPRLSGRGGRLLVCDYVPEPLAARLEAAGWSWVDDAGNYGVHGRGLRLHQRRTTAPPPPARTRRLPQGDAGLRVVRHLAGHDGDLRPAALAATLGLPRPRVAQILARLRHAGLAEVASRGVWRADRAGLLDAFLADYRGPGGTTTSWYSLDEPRAVAQAIVAAQPGAVVSGDVAADVLAPWRRPTHLVVYQRRRLVPSGLVEATGPGDGNVEIRVPADTTVFPSEPAAVDGLVLADPLQVLWDEHRLGGDRLDVVSRVRTWILERS